jgi:hypothetical protein
MYFDDATRAQVVALRSFGATAKQVEEITKIAERTQRRIVKKAKERRFSGGQVLNSHVKDGEKLVRTKKTPYRTSLPSEHLQR